MECKRCGTCCEKGGPTLHRQDLTLFEKGILNMTDCITHRKGELLFDQIEGRVLPLPAELVKVASVSGKTVCRLYKPGECTIHADRPAECRALDCEDPSELIGMYSEGRISRADLVAEGSGMAELMAEHDRQCNLDELALLALRLRKIARDTEAYEALLAMHRYDKAVREKVENATGATDKQMEFFFGRSLTTLFPAFGLRCLDQGGKTILVGTGV
ncbi:MAG: YkgJ family cysteine cluster protein [Desulfovibrio sp.]|uniref:YkgJ family cysteine cluster protein n=1 Tax=Desulfovibrio sp. 7SRBS1 TaxID=3378064 RepID=UPI003B3EF9FE